MRSCVYRGEAATSSLHKLYVALEAVGGDAARTLVRVGLDSIPSTKRSAAPRARHRHAISAPKIASVLQLPTVSTRRALEELAAHGLVTWHKSGDARQRNDPLARR